MGDWERVVGRRQYGEGRGDKGQGRGGIMCWSVGIMG